MKKVLTLKNLGWLFTAFAAIMMVMSGIQKVMGGQEMVNNFTYLKLLPYLGLVGILELLGVVLLLMKKTSVYGAALIGSLMSAAVVMHLSLINSSPAMPIAIGVAAWIGHLLRSIKTTQKGNPIF
jgi:uncharacterized membrane protein YphA (DoxX/SURF4 family)